MTFKRKISFLLPIALLASLSLSLSAFAQNQAVPMPPGPMSLHGKPPQLTEQQKSQMQAKRAERREKKLQELKVFLQLQGNQEAAWSNFYAEMQKTMKKPLRMKPEELEKLTTPERIEKMKAMKAERDSLFNQRIAAVTTFYSSLNPQQQKVFDAQALASIKGFDMNPERRGHQGKMHH